MDVPNFIPKQSAAEDVVNSNPSLPDDDDVVPVVTDIPVPDTTESSNRALFDGLIRMKSDFLKKYINAVNERYQIRPDDSRYGQYKYEMSRHNGYCMRAANKMLENVRSNMNYPKCTKPSFSFFSTTKPSTSPYDACNLMLKIAQNVVEIETQIQRQHVINSNRLPTHIHEVLIGTFSPLVRNTGLDLKDAILQLSGIDVSQTLAKKQQPQEQQYQQQQQQGGKKSKSVRHRKRATRAHRHHRKSSIIRHDLRRGSHKRTVRRLQ